jgi:SH3-like domain-containing protein
MKHAMWIVVVFAVLITAPVLAEERLSISTGIANVRSGPGLNHEILWKVQKYYPVVVLKKQGRWYQFRDFEGDTGWIHASVLSNTPTVITQATKCNIRKGAGTDFPVVFTVESGIPFRVLARKGPWIQIRHADGDQGWIHQSLVW